MKDINKLTFHYPLTIITDKGVETNHCKLKLVTSYSAAH